MASDAPSTLSIDNQSGEEALVSNVEKAADPVVAPVTPPAASYVPPDGGTKAWLAVTGGFFCQFCSFGFLNA